MVSLAHIIPAGVIFDYRSLEDLSRGARYDLQVFTFQDVRDLLDQELAAIATFDGM